MSCYYCTSDDVRHYLTVNTAYSLYHCDSCGLVFTYPQPRGKQVSTENEKVFDSVAERTARTAIYEREYARAIQHITELKRYKQSGRLLDVGCSYGISVKAAGDMGFDAWGVEPTKKAVAYAKKQLHLKVYHGTLDNVKFPSKSFDVVSLYDVLEHVPNLRLLLREIHRMLKPGGIIAIQSPNIESLAFSILRTRWNWLLVPQHLWHFSGRSLDRVLADAGFTVIGKTTEDNPYDFASNWKSTLRIRGVRYGLYLAAYAGITIGTHVWSMFGKGGLLRVYAQKT